MENRVAKTLDEMLAEMKYARDHAAAYTGNMAEMINDILQSIRWYSNWYLLRSSIAPIPYVQSGRAFLFTNPALAQAALQNVAAEQGIGENLLEAYKYPLYEENIFSLLARHGVEKVCINKGQNALTIPHIISGYTTGGASVNIISYAEPGTVDGNDKYRITGMQARGGTPTKAGLLYMLQRLRKMPVDVRLLIVITDGESGDNSDVKVPYTTNPEGKPIRKIVREAKKEGTIIVAAGIGSDREKVCNEFGADNFMDITNLDDMPEQLIGLIKDNIWV